MVARQPLVSQGLLIVEASRSPPHIRSDSSGQVISPTQRPLPDNTQHSQERDILFPGRIEIRNPTKGTDEDLRLRPRGHWDRLTH